MQAGSGIKAIPVKHEWQQFEGSDGKFQKMGVTFKILEGPSLGQEITGLFGFKGKGKAFSTKVMQTCGWNGTSRPSEPWDYEQVSLTIEYETYNDRETGETKSRAVVKYVNALGEKGPDSAAFFEKHRMEKSELDALEEGFMAEIKATQAASGAPVATSVKARPAAPKVQATNGTGGQAEDDDSVPF